MHSRFHTASLAASIAALSVLPCVTFAATGQLLLDDGMGAWEDVRPDRETQLRLFADDDAWQSAVELFPEIAGDAETGTPDPEPDEQTGDVLVVTIAGRQVTFTDVPRASWFGPFVRAAAEAGIMTGYKDANGRLTGEFHPERGVSIEELAKIGVVASGMSTGSCGKTHNATASGSWSAPFAGCAEESGWSVFSDAVVDVKRPATRAEVVVTVLQAYRVSFGEKTGTQFKDVTLATEFGAAIEYAKISGIVSGYADADGKPTGFFGPLENVTRAEMARIITRANQVYARR